MSAPTLSPSSLAITVCMATYNGEAYLRMQIDSVLAQLAPQDVLLVVDDCSSDGTWDILAGYSATNVQIHRNEARLGCVGTFERALAMAPGDVIVLCDQDDIWVPGRLELFRAECAAKRTLVVSSTQLRIDRDGNPLEKALVGSSSEKSSRYYIRNILGIFAGTTPYYGCTMAFKSELLRYILPIPQYVESHDLWIALCGNLCRGNRHLTQVTVHRRIHGSNCSEVVRPLHARLWSRVILGISVCHLTARLVLGGTPAQHHPAEPIAG